MVGGLGGEDAGVTAFQAMNRDFQQRHDALMAGSSSGLPVRSTSQRKAGQKLALLAELFTAA